MLADRQRRNQDDRVAERADDGPSLAGLEGDPMAEPERRIVLAEIDPDHHSPAPDLGTSSMAATPAISSLSRLIFGCRLQGLLLLEHVEAGDRRRAGERVAGEGVAVEEGAELLVLAEEALVDRSVVRVAASGM